MAKKTVEWRHQSSFIEQYFFEQDESDIEEVEESYDSSGTEGIEPLEVDMEFTSLNYSSTPKEELSTLSRGCGRQSGQGRGRKATQDDSTVGKKKAPKSNIDIKCIDLFITIIWL